MSKASDLIEKMKNVGLFEKEDDPGEKKATDQVSKLQKFDFDYIEGEKEYDKFDESKIVVNDRVT